MKLESRDISFLAVFTGCIALIALGHNSTIHNILTAVVAVYWGIDITKKTRRKR